MRPFSAFLLRYLPAVLAASLMATNQNPMATGISLATGAYWMRRANEAIAETGGSPCPFSGFGTVIVNHTSAEEGGELVCMGANQMVQTGNPSLHGEMAAINNCTAIMTDPHGRYRLTPHDTLAAFRNLTLYTNAESCPMIIYANTPSPAINPSLQNGTFKLNTTTLPDNQSAIPKDKVLVRVHYLSLDPAMRQWLTAKRSYIAPVERGSVMRGQSIAQVVAVGTGLTSQYKVGDWVVAYSGWQDYALLGAKEAQKVTVPAGCQPTDAMSVLGMTGLTAYFGMTEVGQTKPGNTVVVSGAAGATGMVAGQIAKIQGAKRVVGLAGSADKCAFLTRELGFHSAVNYKDADWKKQLKEATPEYIDVFFDNVGGEILDACLARAARDARFVICGAISQYNSAKPQGPSSFMTVISQRVTMKGFIVFDYAKKYSQGLKDLATWLAQGKLKRKEHIVPGGLEAAPQALVNLYEGANTGKMMVEVAPVEQRARL